MGKRLGFSVGINDYPAEPLQKALADTRRCCEELRRINVPCIVCENPDLKKVESYLFMFCEQITECYDFILFNFNGHCEVAGGECREPMLVLKDGKQMPVNTVIEKLVNATGSHDATILCLMNCCRGISQKCADEARKPNNRKASGRALVTKP